MDNKEFEEVLKIKEDMKENYEKYFKSKLLLELEATNICFIEKHKEEIKQYLYSAYELYLKYDLSLEQVKEVFYYFITQKGYENYTLKEVFFNGDYEYLIDFE